MSNINNIILQEDLFSSLLHAGALAALGGGAIYASHTPAVKGVYHGIKTLYYKKKAENALNSGNYKDAISHGKKMISSGVNAAINYAQSPTLQTLAPSPTFQKLKSGYESIKSKLPFSDN